MWYKHQHGPHEPGSGQGLTCVPCGATVGDRETFCFATNRPINKTRVATAGPCWLQWSVSSMAGSWRLAELCEYWRIGTRQGGETLALG